MTRPLRSLSLLVVIVVSIRDTSLPLLNKTAVLVCQLACRPARLSRFDLASCASRALFFFLAQLLPIFALLNYPFVLSLGPVLENSLSHLAQLFPDQFLSIVRLVRFTRFVVRDVQKFFNFISKLRMAIQSLRQFFRSLLARFHSAHGTTSLATYFWCSSHPGGHLLPYFQEGLPSLWPKSHF